MDQQLRRKYYPSPFKFPHTTTSFEYSNSFLRLNNKQKVHNNNNHRHHLESSSMDDSTITLILRGCNQARELESNLESLAKQPQLLYNSCDEIAKAFDTAKKRLQPAYNMPHELHAQQMQIDATTLQELLQTIDAARGSLPESSRMINVAELLPGSGGGLHLPAMDATLFSAGMASGASSSSQRPRKRYAFFCIIRIITFTN